MVNRMVKITFTSIAMTCLIQSVDAQQGWVFDKNVNVNPNREFEQKLPEKLYEDITSDQKNENIALTKEQQHEALVWGLSEEQERRYVMLMKNRSGIYYKNSEVDPVEVLGINSRTDEERRYFANLHAKQEAQRTAKELTFNKLSSESYKELVDGYRLPAIRAFDTKKYSPYHYEPISLLAHDKLMFFVRINDPTRRIMTPLMSSLLRTKNVQLNIYFIDKDIKEKEISDWAALQNIPPKWVETKMVTLNKGFDKYSRIGNEKTLPALFLVRNEESISIDLSRF